MSSVERVNLPQIVSISNVLDILEQRYGQAGTDVEPVNTRVATKAQWAKPRAFDSDQREQVTSLAAHIGVTLLPADPRPLTPEEADMLMAETEAIRETQDICQGRYDRIRATVFDAISSTAEAQATEDPGMVPGEIVAPDAGKRFVREVRGGKLVPNLAALEDVIPADVWRRIVRYTETIRVVRDADGTELSRNSTTSEFVDEDAALVEIRAGNISLEDIAKTADRTKRVPYFTIAAVKVDLDPTI